MQHPFEDESLYRDDSDPTNPATPIPYRPQNNPDYPHLHIAQSSPLMSTAPKYVAPRRPSEPSLHQPSRRPSDPCPALPSRTRRPSASTRPTFRLDESLVSVQTYDTDPRRQDFDPSLAHPAHVFHPVSHQQHNLHQNHIHNQQQEQQPPQPEQTYQILKFFRNYLNPSNLRNSRRQESSGRENPRQQPGTHRNPSTDTQHRPLVSTSSSGDRSSGKSCHCSRYWVPIILLVFSFTALGISSFLLYHYLQPADCKSHGVSSQGGGVAAALTSLNKSISAHVRLSHDGKEKENALLKPIQPVARKNYEPTHIRGLELYGYGLAVRQTGNYYVYFSVSIHKSKIGSKAFRVDLMYTVPGGGWHMNTRLIQSIHTWCKDCDLEIKTLYSGGVFRLERDGLISVNVTNSVHVTNETYLGLFMVD